ncbi:aquaporin [Sanguibacter sp. 25GB23B1]|uniref:MIP/aquaporin family protein n=1 Tax=unclassified Sanguibacter TaxID=2645534 RepID=UPI0032AF7E03
MSQDASAQQTLIEDRTVSDRRLSPAGDTDRPSTFAVIGAELFGTFLLVFVGLGIALYATYSGAGALGVALGFGIALMAGMASVGHISGGHFNPAVTLGYAVAGRTSWKDVPVYWVAQIVGAVAAAATLFTTIPKSFASGDTAAYGSLKEFFSITANGFGDNSPSFATASAAFFKTYLDQGATQEQIDEAVSAGQLVVPTFAKFDATSVAIIEVVATALFVGVILAVTDKRARIRFTSVVVGLSFGFLVLLASPLSGGSLNPARSLAAALFSDSWALGDVWIFWAAPLVGAIIAALFYRGFTTTEPVVEYVYRDDTLDGEDDVDVVTEVEEVVVVTEVVPADEPSTSTDTTSTTSTTAAAAPAPTEPVAAEPAPTTEAAPSAEPAPDAAPAPVKKAPVRRAPAKTPAKAPAKAQAKPPVARKAPAKKAPTTGPAADGAASAPASPAPPAEPSTDSVDSGPDDTVEPSK